MILTVTDAKGIEVDTAGERRVEPVPGWDPRISIDRSIQEYATQLAEQACATKEADSVYIIAMIRETEKSWPWSIIRNLI